MPHWSDAYPHKIWTNILTIDNKIIDYKIGGNQRDKSTWTMRFNKELHDRFNEIEVISTFEDVNDDIEHQQAFENGTNRVKEHAKKYGSYCDCMNF